jgi:hypothetical protein
MAGRRLKTGYALSTWLSRFDELSKEMMLMVEDGRIDVATGLRVIAQMNEASRTVHRSRNGQ